MVAVVFSWLMMGALALIFGKAIVDRIYRDDLDTMGKWDFYLMAGIIFLNVYAQIFSLFYKVSKTACLILFAAGAVLVCRYLVVWIRERKSSLDLGLFREHPYRLALILAGGGGTLAWMLQAPGHYDTGLYHAQAIRWIEEYGIVPGLGNLHTRLAYNSAFMSLQALFSLKWLLGQSLHTLNGFFCLFCIGYAVMTVRTQKEERWRVSDILKCFMLLYIVMQRHLLSSPCTDIWAMLLVFYVSSKWFELTERDEQAEAPWCFICLTAIYAVTVKLSTATIVLLAAYPLIMLIGNREWKRVLENIATALFVTVPFLVRNVIISGYLIYPCSGLDLFPVDWKMAASQVDSDNFFIKIYGWGYTKKEAYEESLIRRIPHWFLTQRTGTKMLILAGTICAVILLFQLCKYVRAGSLRESVFIITILISLLFWFFTAPLDRYGAVYFMIVIAAAVGEIMNWRWKAVMNLLADISALLVMIVLCGIYLGRLEVVYTTERAYFVRQPDYLEWPVVQRRIDDAVVWVPSEGDQGGYEPFPSTPYQNPKKIHLRGDSFKEGFYREK